MKKALTIVLLVAAYSLCETLLLLFTIARIDLYPFSLPYQWIIWWAQIALIPCSAALFSRLLYGSYRWGSRALTILVVSIATIGFLAAVLCVDYVVSSFTLPSLVTLGLFLFFVLLVACGIGVLLFLFFRNVARRTAAIESRRWLADRQAGIDPEAIRWRNRGVRWALFVPSAFVLLVFLFLPEAWGIVSQLSHPRARALGGYHIPIPIAWIVLDQGETGERGDVSIRGLAARNLRSYFGPKANADFPLSTWTVRVAPTNRSPETARALWRPQDSEVIGRRVLTVGNESVTCLEYWPSYFERPVHVEASERAFVTCSGSQRLSASLYGRRIHLSAFYRMIEGIQLP